MALRLSGLQSKATRTNSKRAAALWFKTRRSAREAVQVARPRKRCAAPHHEGRERPRRGLQPASSWSEGTLPRIALRLSGLQPRPSQNGAQALRGDGELRDGARHSNGIVNGCGDGRADRVDAA